MRHLQLPCARNPYSSSNVLYLRVRWAHSGLGGCGLRRPFAAKHAWEAGLFVARNAQTKCKYGSYQPTPKRSCNTRIQSLWKERLRERRLLCKHRRIIGHGFAPDLETHRRQESKADSALCIPDVAGVGEGGVWGPLG